MLSKKQIKELRKHITKLEAFEQEIDKGVVDLERFIQRFYNGIVIIHDIFEEDSDEWHLFNKWKQKYSWKPRSRSGSYAGARAKAKVNENAEIIKKILEMNLENTTDKKEWVFSKEEKYEANRFIMKILESASEKVVVVDNYLDNNIFDFIDNIDNKVNVYLITDSRKPIFKKLFISLSEKRENIKARFNSSSHDRFIAVDDREVYALGASFNTIGKKDFMINKLEDPKTIKEKLRDFQQYWKRGEKVI